jgi:DNA-directed RNA polymerase beta' subunit
MLTIEAQERRRQEMLKSKTHFNQQITTRTKKLLEKLCKKSKLSKPMQLEKIVEECFNKQKAA